MITRVEEKKYLLQNIDYRDEEVMNNLDKDWLKCDSFNKKVAGRTFNIVANLQGVVFFFGSPFVRQMLHAITTFHVICEQTLITSLI